jgi:hypothetical protein
MDPFFFINGDENPNPTPHPVAVAPKLSESWSRLLCLESL